MSALCPERLRLLREYRQAAERYADAVRQMSDLIYAGVDAEASLARKLSRTAWDTLEKARIALARHEADHFCDRFSVFSEGKPRPEMS